MGASTVQDDKKKALGLAIAQIEKSHGKGAIMKMGSSDARVRVDAISTGAINLDAAIGVGGIPRGRVTEIYGPESSGKTTLCLHVVANAQKAGGVAAYIDAEHALDTDYAIKLGVMFGNPETTTGGKALKFYASVRLDIRRIAPVKEKEDVIGSHVRVKVVKNKVAPPFKQAEFDIMYAEGISHASLVLDIAAESGIIDKSGAWYSYGAQRIGQGRENAKMDLKDNPSLHAEVEEEVKPVPGIKPPAGGEREVERADSTARPRTTTR